MATVAILGAGIGGLSQAYELRKALGRDHDIVVINDTDYFEFTLTADSGYVLDMTSITFGIGRSGTGPVNWQWRSSVDSFGSAITTYTTVATGLTLSSGVLTNPDSNSSWTGSVLDLSGAAFQDLNSITFRFYGYAAEGGTGTGGFQGNLVFAGAMESTNPIGAVYWAPSAGGGGTGTWSTVDTNWATAAGGVGGGQTQGTGTLIFGDTAGTATVSGTVTVSNGMTFQTTGYLITGGTAVNLAGDSTAVNAITTDTGVTATVAAPLTGSNGLTKSGNGTLVLSAANGLGGAVNVITGTLDLGASGALTNISSLSIAGSVVLSGAAGDRLSDTATIDISAGGSLDLAGLSETVGALQLTAATVQTGAGTLTLGGNVTINDGSTSTVSSRPSAVLQKSQKRYHSA